MLKQRLLTAAILIPLVIWGILELPATGFAALLAAFVLLGAWEWSRLCGIRQPRWRLLYLLLFALALFLLWRHAQPLVIRMLLEIAMIGWLGAIWLLLLAARGREPLRERKWPKYGIGFLLLLPPFVALEQLHSDPHFGPRYVLLLLVLIWTADSAAYFSGRRLGRHKLIPRVSPGKSWEGVAGALLATALLAAVAADWFELPLMAFVFLSIVITVISIAGDLTESLFKRQAGVKDSGTLLPGHGGVLDRIDSLTSAAPFFLAGMLWITGRL